MGHGSKTRSQNQILEKPYICSEGQIFSPRLMKIGENVSLHEILDEFENGLCQVKNLVTRSNITKTFCTLQRPHFQPSTLERWSKRFP